MSGMKLEEDILLILDGIAAVSRMFLSFLSQLQLRPFFKKVTSHNKWFEFEVYFEVLLYKNK